MMISAITPTTEKRIHTEFCPDNSGNPKQINIIPNTQKQASQYAPYPKSNHLFCHFCNLPKIKLNKMNITLLMTRLALCRLLSKQFYDFNVPSCKP